MKPAAHAALLGSITLLESAIYPPPHTWGHRCPPLTSVAVIDRGQGVCHPPTQTILPILLSWTPCLWYAITGIQTPSLLTIGWALFCRHLCTHVRGRGLIVHFSKHVTLQKDKKNFFLKNSSFLALCATWRKHIFAFTIPFSRCGTMEQAGWWVVIGRWPNWGQNGRKLGKYYICRSQLWGKLYNLPSLYNEKI